VFLFRAYGKLLSVTKGILDAILLAMLGCFLDALDGLWVLDFRL